MIGKAREIPPKYYHLLLFNIGLLLALSKHYSLLHVLSSLAFVTLIAAPIALHFNILEKDKVQIVHEAIQAKVANLYSSVLSFLKGWREVE